MALAQARLQRFSISLEIGGKNLKRQGKYGFKKQ